MMSVNAVNRMNAMKRVNRVNRVKPQRQKGCLSTSTLSKATLPLLFRKERLGGFVFFKNSC